jgi:hypothetical protein
VIFGFLVAAKGRASAIMQSLGLASGLFTSTFLGRRLNAVSRISLDLVGVDPDDKNPSCPGQFFIAGFAFFSDLRPGYDDLTPDFGSVSSIVDGGTTVMLLGAALIVVCLLYRWRTRR